MRRTISEKARTIEKKITRAHISQSLMAGLFILLVFWVMHSIQSELAVASLGASTFITFSSPNADASRPRFLIGGYFVGVTCGLLCFVLAKFLPDFMPFPVYVLACALAVFLAMFIMTAFALNHPPAVALSIAITISTKPLILSLAAVSCVTLLCALKESIKKYLHNL